MPRMAVSDASVGVKPKRILRPLSPATWELARLRFESTGPEITYQAIADQFNTSISSVQKRSAAQKWRKTEGLVVSARRELATATDRHLTAAADKAGSQVAKELMRDLQPFIEREKRAQIQRAIKRSKRGQRRLDKIAGGYQVYDARRGRIVDVAPDPKDEMHFATAEDKYDNIIRRNLGMNDSSPVATPFSVAILANHAAVQFVSPPNDQDSQS